MTSILLSIKQLNATDSDTVISETKDFFWIFVCIFEMRIKFWSFSKKDDSHSWCIFEITVYEKGD